MAKMGGSYGTMPIQSSNAYSMLSPHSDTDIERAADHANYSDDDVSSQITLQSNSSSSRSSRVDPRFISDAIIGLSDGLTVPFALTAGLSALGNTHVVIYGGLAELIAGSISMGLGGYLGAKSEAESYSATQLETREKIATDLAGVEEEVKSILDDVGLPDELGDQVTRCLVDGDEKHLTKFLMRFEHSLPEPPPNRALVCALTIALGYFVGGFIPLLPYFFVGAENVQQGLLWSAGVMVVTLFLFGFVKTTAVHGFSDLHFMWKSVKGGAEMVLVGSLAAGAAMGLVILFSGRGGPV